MAESLSDPADSASKGKGNTVESQSREGFPCIPECAVCLQTCVHPARLPCNHVFCFLCLKGLATQGRRCAMCRQDIPADYLEHPELLEYPTFEKDPQSYKWFYEGRNGWWQYDERTSNELENAYKNGLRTCELLIAGTLYLANFDGMIQQQKNDRSRWRRIKRDLSTVPKKGVAGLRIDVVLPPPSSSDESSNQSRSDDDDNAPPSTSFTQYRVRQEESDSSESEESEVEEGYEVYPAADEVSYAVYPVVDEVSYAEVYPVVDEVGYEVCPEVDEVGYEVCPEVDEEGYRGDSSNTDSDTE